MLTLQSMRSGVRRALALFFFFLSFFRKPDRSPASRGSLYFFPARVQLVDGCDLCRNNAAVASRRSALFFPLFFSFAVGKCHRGGYRSLPPARGGRETRAPTRLSISSEVAFAPLIYLSFPLLFFLPSLLSFPPPSPPLSFPSLKCSLIPFLSPCSFHSSPLPLFPPQADR